MVHPERAPATGRGVGEEMDKYQCTVCGYIYDPELGDLDNGVEPGTPFESLPDEWECPVCGAPKSDFERID